VVENKKIYAIMAMGAGKTASVLFALDTIDKLGDPSRTLIIAPKAVADSTWRDELEAWDFLRGKKIVNATGLPKKKREQVVGEPHDILVINRENVKWLYGNFPVNYDVLVYDEASRLKAGRTFTKNRINPKTGEPVPRTLSEFGVMKKMSSRFSRAIAMTGTPTQEGVLDLWGQIYILDQGERLGHTRNAFTQRWFNHNPFNYTTTPRPGAEEEILKKIKDIAFFIDVETDRPEPLVIDHKIELPDAARRRYRELARTLAIEDMNIFSADAMVAAHKLIQLANGHVYDEDKEPRHMHDAKIEKLKELADCDDNLLVWYSFKSDAARIKELFPHAVSFDEIDKPVQAWNSGEIKMLLAHPQNAGHGISLQYGGYKSVWYGLPWSLELYLQANKRLDRPGQTERVEIHRIIARDTIEEKIIPKLKDKGQRMNQVMEALRHVRR
jgi:SNF2 family DNA or RNA helicase